MIGVDYSPRMIEIALTKNSNTKIDYKIQDLEKMSFSDSSFDCIVDTFGMEYYLNPRKVLNEMKRVCKEDGVILLLNQGLPENEYLQRYYRWKLPLFLLSEGYFPHRPWDKIIS